MHELEVFFDYTCPYCLKAHGFLRELLPQFPEISIVWRPCEAHPRPERYGLHSDLCIQGLFCAMEQGADLWEYHDRMYRAALVDRVNIEDSDVVAWCTQGFNLSLGFASFGQAINLMMRGAMTYQVELGTDAFGNIQRIINALDKLPERLEGSKNQLANLEKQVAAAKEELEKPFALEDELKAKESRIALPDPKAPLIQIIIDDLHPPPMSKTAQPKT